MNTVINKMPDKKECEHDYRVYQTAPYDYCLVCSVCQLYKKTMTDYEVIDWLIERNGILKSQLREQKPEAKYKINSFIDSKKSSTDFESEESKPEELKDKIKNKEQ